MRVLIAGGCGYIGSALRVHLQGRGIRVHTCDLGWFGNGGSPLNWLKDYGTLTAAELAAYDWVVITAAHSSVPMCNAQPHAAFANNVGNFTRVLSRLAHTRLLYASSSCVYHGGPMPGSEGPGLPPPADMLTLTKGTIDACAQLSDVEFYGLRFGSVNGGSPNLRSDLMVNSMVKSAVRDGCVRVGNPENTRPILGMRDLTRAVTCVLESPGDRRGLYNLASFTAAIGEIGQAVAGQFGVPVVALPATQGYDFSMTCDKFQQAFDWQPEETLGTIIGSLAESGPGQGRERAPEYAHA